MDPRVKKYLDQIYDVLVPRYCENIPEAEKERYAAKYRQLLEEKYAGTLQKLILDNEPEGERLAKKVIDSELAVRVGKSHAAKERSLFPDRYYTELEAISSEVLSRVAEYLKSGKTLRVEPGYYESARKRCDACLEKMDQRYLSSARRLYSEIITDLNYITGKSTNVSLRVGRYYQKYL